MSKRKRQVGSQLAGFLNPDALESQSNDSTEAKSHSDTNKQEAKPTRAKRSYYLRDDVIEMVDDLEYHAGKAIDGTVNKSDVVGYAIELIFADFQERGKDSALINGLRERIER